MAGILAGGFSGSAEASCLMRLDAAGVEGSADALRFPSAGGGNVSGMRRKGRSTWGVAGVGVGVLSSFILMKGGGPVMEAGGRVVVPGVGAGVG